MNWFGFVSGAILAILTMKVAVAGPPGAPGVAPIEVVVLGTFHFDNPGLDYASVAKLRGDIVYGRLSGFGPVGPDAELPAIDELAAARTGMMPILPQPGQPPVYTGSGAMHAAVMLAFGVVTALVHRVDSNEGQEVDVSLFGANMYGAALDIQAFLAIGKGDRLLNPISRLDVSNPMSGSL